MAQVYKVAGQQVTSEVTKSVTNKSVSNNVVTLTTSEPHNIVVGQPVTLVEAVQQASVTNKALTSNVATLTIPGNRIAVGQSVLVNISDASFDGTFVVSNRTSTTISYSVTAANVASTQSSGTVEYSDTAFNGSFIVDSNPDDTTFTYSTVSDNLQSTATNNFSATYLPWKIVATCPQNASLVISSLMICNQNSVPTRYQVAVADSLDFGNENIIFYNDVLDGLDTITITSGIVLDPTNKYLLVAADREIVSVSAFAVEVS